MLFATLLNNAKKYSNRVALNNWKWSELIEIIDSRSYKEFTTSSGVEILLDILKAASVNKPIVVPPISGNYLHKSLTENFNITLYSSGSTTQFKKSIVLSEKMLMSNAENSIQAHNITSDDKILTVCSTNHTGGINAQTIPALVAGAHVIVKDKFEPYKFWNDIFEHNITITHLVPRMMDTLIRRHGSRESPLRLVTCGSDCIKKEYVSWWQNCRVPFMINYGMTEAGPIIINHKFNPDDDLSIFDFGVPLGTQRWCDVNIIDGELWLKGNAVVGDGWLRTDDCVEQYKEWLIYKGRKSAGCKIIPKSY